MRNCSKVLTSLILSGAVILGGCAGGAAGDKEVSNILSMTGESAEDQTLAEDPNEEQVGNTLEEGAPESVTDENVADAEEISKEKSVYVSKADVPEGTFQADFSFPEWRGFADDTLALNDMMSFDFYSGQGKMYLLPDEGVESFDFYINSKKVDVSNVLGGSSYEVDFSEVALNGRNTLQVSNVTPFDGETKVRVIVPYPEVLEGTPSEVGINEEALSLISDIIESDVAHGFTSSQLAVIRHGKLVYQNAWGYKNTYSPDGEMLSDKEPVDNNTLYDLASVTKMAGVNLAIQKMVTDGTIRVDDKISDHLGPEFYEMVINFRYKGYDAVSDEDQLKWKANLTIKDVLCHRAGFPADPKYFNASVDIGANAYSYEGANLLYSGCGDGEKTKAETYNSICKTPLMYEPGTKTLYSDVDYMLLGFLVEKVSGQDLNTYLKENFWEPMQLTNITYNPLENGFKASDCAATELSGNTRDGQIYFPGVRTETLQGQVHDEKAFYSMGGVSGHAGLFSNATDLAKLFSTMLTGGYGNNRFYSRACIDLFTSPNSEDGAAWGLGWWREGEFQRVGFFGTQSGNNTFGHQGWTGTIAIIDPDRDLVIVYLTNKINSRLINKANTGRFRGGAYTAATLGFVPQILSIGMDTDEDITGQLTDLLASMTRESVELIPIDAEGDNPYYDNAKSKLELLEKRCKEFDCHEYDSLIEEIKNKLYK